MSLDNCIWVPSGTRTDVCGLNQKSEKDKPVDERYAALTKLERWIPVAFSVLYIGLAGYALLAPVDKKVIQETQPTPSEHEIRAAPPTSEKR